MYLFTCTSLLVSYSKVYLYHIQKYNHLFDELLSSALTTLHFPDYVNYWHLFFFTYIHSSVLELLLCVCACNIDLLVFAWHSKVPLQLKWDMEVFKLEAQE